MNCLTQSLVEQKMGLLNNKLISIEGFISDFSKEVKMHIGERKVRTSKEAAQAAEDHALTQKCGGNFGKGHLTATKGKTFASKTSNMNLLTESFPSCTGNFNTKCSECGKTG